MPHSFALKQVVQNTDGDMSYVVQKRHRDGTVTVTGLFSLNKHQRDIPGTFAGDLRFRVPASSLRSRFRPAVREAL